MFLTLMWMAVAVGMITVITAAMKVQKTLVCTGYIITITGADQEKLFTSQEQIVKLIKAATNGEIKGKRLQELDLPRIEDLLEQSAWVYNVELYFDNIDRLRVNVIERKPLARIFTNLGTSFYIDEAGKHIPLSEKISLDVPVFTGYPVKKVWSVTDSVLLQNIIATASFISQDPFWSSQVSQIDIRQCGTDCWDMEMIPVVGNHRVQLGDGSDVAAKFHRLYLFYDQVLKRKGFDKYQKIDVQYDGQVLGVKGSYTKVDSLQLRKNIENLLYQSRQANELMEETHNSALNPYVLDTTSASNELYTTAEPGMPEDDLADTPVPPAAIITQKTEAAKKLPAVVAAKKTTVERQVKKVEPNKDAHPAPVKKQGVKTAPKKTDVKPPAKKETGKNAEIKHGQVKKEVAKPAATAKKQAATKEVKKSVVANKPATTMEIKKPASKVAKNVKAEVGKKPAAIKPKAAATKGVSAPKTTAEKKRNR